MAATCGLTLFTRSSFFKLSIIGRALTYATKFENEVIALYNFNELTKDQNILNNDEKFAKLIEKLEKHINLNSRIININFNSEITTLITNAKNARNYIAHELTIGLNYSSESNEVRKSILNILIEKVSDIAKGELLILLVMTIWNKETVPDVSFLSHYPNKIIEWVTNLND